MGDTLCTEGDINHSRKRVCEAWNCRRPEGGIFSACD